MADPRLEPLVLSEDERRILENWARRRRTAQGLALQPRAGQFLLLYAAVRGRRTAQVVMLLRQVGDRPGWWICPDGAV